MGSFYYDVSKLKKEFTEPNLINYGDFIAECFRSSNLFKDGWCESKVLDLKKDKDDNLEWIQLHIRWGLDEEGYIQQWYETIEYDKESFLKEFEKNFPNKTDKPKLEVVK